MIILLNPASLLLIAENRDFLGTDFIGNITRTIADKYLIGKGIRRMLFARQAGEECIGKSTAKIASDYTIGHQDLDLPPKPIAGTEFWDWIDFK